VKITAIIQARMSSKRLPGKVLMQIGNNTMLGQVVNRAKRIEGVDDVVVSTSKDSSDFSIVEWCRKNKISCFSGPLDNVLLRFVWTARKYNSDVIIRLTADCPLLDPEVVSFGLNTYLNSKQFNEFTGFEIVANGLISRSWPDGLDFCILSKEALEFLQFEIQEYSFIMKEKSIKVEMKTPEFYQEHVTPWVTDHPEHFKVLDLIHSPNLAHYRWTVDMREDLEFVRKVYQAFPGSSVFGMNQIIEKGFINGKKN